MPNLYNLQFTDVELDTVANAMEDYMQYDDEKLNTKSLFGGLSVADRVNSINNKISSTGSIRAYNKGCIYFRF